MRRVGTPHKLFTIYYHIVCAVTWLSDAIIDWNMMSTKNVCCAENRFKIFVWHFCQPCCVVETCNNTTYLSKDLILVLTIVIICNCWSSKNQVDGQTKIERVFVESAVVIFVIFPASALCTLWGEAGETSSQVGAYFGCGFTTLSFRWKKHLMQVTTLLQSSSVLLRLLWVAFLHPGLLCIETHFRVLSVGGAPLLCSVLSAWLVAAYCERQWVGETSGGGAGQVSSPANAAASYLRRCSPASPPCSPGCIIQNPLGDFRLLWRGHGAAPQVGTLADWQADWGPADHRRDNAGKTGLTAWSKLVSEYECFGLQMRLLPNSICVQYHCVLQQTKRRSCVLKKAQHWSTNISGSGWPPGGRSDRNDEIWETSPSFTNLFYSIVVAQVFCL